MVSLIMDNAEFWASIGPIQNDIPLLFKENKIIFYDTFHYDWRSEVTKY
jgi:hypothetical protein